MLATSCVDHGPAASASASPGRLLEMQDLKPLLYPNLYFSKIPS